MPYAFTEQGVYMLMTVLRSDLAVKQSKDFVRTFKENEGLYSWQSEPYRTARGYADFYADCGEYNRNK